MRCRALVVAACSLALAAAGASAAAGSDPLAPRAWYLERVGAAGKPAPGPGTPLSIIDAAIDRGYPEFEGRADTEVVDEPCAGFDSAHATTIAAIAAAPENGIGIAGVYPTASLRSVETCGLDDPALIAAIDRAVARGRSVIVLSLGSPGYARPLEEAILRAVDAGSLVVAAAGNYRGVGDPLTYPAAYPHVLTVASTDRDDRPSAFSGSRAVDLAAPGEGIAVLDPHRPTEPIELDGTSYATPIAAAVAAWVWTVRPSLDATQLAEILRSSARDVGEPGFDRRTGFGIVDLTAALAEPAPPSDPLEPNEDVDLVAPGRLFSAGKPLLGSGSLAARVDRVEDPRDVYRVRVPAGERLQVRVTSSARVRVQLFRAKTRTVVGKAAARRRLAAATARPGRPAGLSYRNRGQRAAVLYLSVAAASARADYTLRTRTR